MEEKNFIKRIKRLEVRRAIEDLRECLNECKNVAMLAAEQGFPTLVAFDYALVAETEAARNKVKRLFSARNLLGI